ncbi:ABC transporter permease [Breznakiella homolactica]|uniref:ABC transporter permease n=1 Tax=Breznakiella homolactica TaxID=2798577 RepID=A0A7T7XMM4_9SPIR|nr:ABC transporter permease [Breznakiella homolactica]QQO09086.1 ABC transporter permease [Breznakiella homolactica]
MNAESGKQLLVTFGKKLISNYLVLVLILTVVVGSIVSPYFLTSRNLGNILQFSAVISIIAVGQFFVVVTGGIDLSVGSIAAFATVISAVMMAKGIPAVIAAACALGLSALWGAVNGALVTGAKITPFVVTLATQSIVRGCAYLVQSGSLIGIYDNNFIWAFSGKTLGIPNPVILFIAVMLVAAFVMHYTTFGRSLYAIGGNSESARLSGIPVKRSLLKVYTINGLLSGLGGLVLAAQLTQGSSLLAKGYELDTIAAVVVGGASLAGGTGGPIGSVIGGLIIYSITNIMNLLTIPSEPQMVVKGLMIILAVIMIGDGTKKGKIRRIKNPKNQQ